MKGLALVPRLNVRPGASPGHGLLPGPWETPAGMGDAASQPGPQDRPAWRGAGPCGEVGATPGVVF